MRFVSRSITFRASVALRSSLITDDNASGFIPCSQSRTQIDRVSISNPVFNILEISNRTATEKNKSTLVPKDYEISMNENVMHQI